MDSFSKEGEKKKKITEVKTFPVPFALGEKKEHITITTNTPSKQSKEQIINQAFKFHSQGNILEAAKYYQHFINQGFKDQRIFLNFGAILHDHGDLQKAELLTRKAIKINPGFAEAHSNLSNILKDLGELQEAEMSARKAIKLNPNYSDAYLNLGSILHSLNKLKEAEIFSRKAIEKNPYSAKANNNLSKILINQRQLKEAEILSRKAIELNPNYSDAYLNLGIVLKSIGNLQEAEISTRRGIELSPDIAKGYYDLSLLNYTVFNKNLQDQLFSKRILKNKSKNDQIYILFARANFHHKERNYSESEKYLKLANKLKLDINPSNADTLIDKSKKLLVESEKKEINKKGHKSSTECIFIVGMPRSGSTLLESILNMDSSVDDLGESNILEESFQDSRKNYQTLNLADIYLQKIKDRKKLAKKITDKNLYNYLYAGIITENIPHSKIIHCYRNPLDNILSIYRANFATSNEYSSSLVDCTKVYLDQEKIMDSYKARYRSKIYDLNYDLLVSDPNKEIKRLISWLGWEWDDAYLSPHLNQRSVSTASNVQVRSPINSKSIGGWKNYKEMLKPAIEILAQTDRYRDLMS